MTTTLDRNDASGPGASGAAGLARSKAVWAVVITGLALFMASLDNLVVSTALPVIRVNLHAGLSGLEWTVNAYTLTFAVLLLSAAAVGERIGRRRTFIIGIAVFTLASAAAALAPSIGVLVAARAIQGAGGAMIMPLSLTLLSAAVPPERRNAALGIWGAIGGTGRGHRTAGRRGGHHRLGLAVHLLAQRSHRADPGPPGLVEAVRIPGASVATGLRRCHPGQHWPVRRGLRPGPGQLPRLDQHRGPDLVRRGRGRLGRLRLVGAPGREPDAAAAPVQEPGVRRRQRDGHAVQLRDVRLDLLPVPVPPDRPGLLAARRWASGCCRGPG